MGYAALSCLGDALDATEDLLLPVDRGLWLRLAVVVFFLSGGSGVGSLFNFSWQAGTVNVDGPTADVPAGTAPSDLLGEYLPYIVAIVAVFALVGLLFAFVGAVMEFVLVDALRTESLSLRSTFREHARKGLSLLALQVVLFVLFAVVVGGTAAVTVLPAIDGGGAALAGGLVLTGLVGLVVGALAGLVYVVTVAFVVPTMLAEDRGLRSAWGRFWSVLWGNLGQFLVYVVIRIGLLVGAGVVLGTVVGVVGFVLAIPFVILAGILFFGGGATLSVGLAVGLAVLAVVYVLTLLVFVAVAQVPIKAYTRYYELLVLGDIDADLDLVRQRREELRSDPF
jgi:hypothetical protein